MQEIEEREKFQKEIKKALAGIGAANVFKDRTKFVDAVDGLGLKLKAPVMKAILEAFRERDETAEICKDNDGYPEPDSELRDCENVPLQDDIDEYFKREVLPHMPDAWMDRSKDKIGYEINFTKEFYKYKPQRSLDEIRKDILALEKETEGLLMEALR